MRISTGLVTLLMATTLSVPASFAQDAGGGMAADAFTCATLAELEAEDARLFMRGYLAGRRDALGSGMLQAGAGADAASGDQIDAGPDGAASPVGGTPEDPATTTETTEGEAGEPPDDTPEDGMDPASGAAEGDAPTAGDAPAEDAEATQEGAAETAPADGGAAPDGAMASNMSVDDLVDTAVAACEGGADRALFDVATEDDPRDPMNTEPGLAGPGAPQPD